MTSEHPVEARSLETSRRTQEFVLLVAAYILLSLLDVLARLRPIQYEYRISLQCETQGIT
jgi:hypothetical protein